ncbi:MAG: septal ring lytic transglycosylase RlpA family protein [Devosiaceae bacterium]|nr:septal ring lytic transglycosylase RlpA family protein [Devosiaceae bacterium]
MEENMLKLTFCGRAISVPGFMRGAVVVGISLLGAACSGPTSDSVARNSGNNSIINNVSKFSVSAFGVAASPRVTSSLDVPKGGGRYMVGQPYKVAGRWYTPSENPSYDKTGTASWYGPNFHGRLTANGEVFDQFHLSGAHPTLPLPSYVRVKNISNGRSVVVRINDRGPFSNNRIIDLSRRTAEVLGFINAGTTQVRVTYLGRAPVEGDDTSYLVASINAPGGLDGVVPTSRPGSVRQPSIISRQSGGLLGAFASLFSYAGGDQAGQIVSDAHAAANAVAERDMALANWKASVESDIFTGSYDLGVFPGSELTYEIARQFALLAAVDIRALQNGTGGNTIQLLISELKPGVAFGDILALRDALNI